MTDNLGAFLSVPRLDCEPIWVSNRDEMKRLFSSPWGLLCFYLLFFSKLSAFAFEQPLPGQYVQVGKQNIWIVEVGRGDSILFVHGIPTSSYLWREVQSSLSSRYHTLSSDLVGLGKSPLDDNFYPCLKNQAILLAKLLDRKSIDRVHLVSHDVGGAVAVHFADLFPERVHSLTLINTAVLQVYWPVKMVQWMQKPIIGEIGKIFFSHSIFGTILKDSVYNPQALSPGEIRQYYNDFRSHRGKSSFLKIIRAFNPQAVEEALYRVASDNHFPVNILWGMEDNKQILAEGRDLQQLFKWASYKEIPQAGHFWQEEQPKKMVFEIHRFLEKVKQFTQL